MKSWLWRVALLTVVPARWTLSSIAVGVKTPVLPTAISISNSFVCFSSGGYLKAIAHLGYFAVEPRMSLCEKSSTLITAPSISYSSEPLASPILSISAIASSMLSTFLYVGIVLKPSSFIKSSDSLWELSSTPSICWMLKTNMSSPLLAATLLSFCLKEPAAAFRGFLKGFSPFIICLSTTLSKLFFGI